MHSSRPASRPLDRQSDTTRDGDGFHAPCLPVTNALILAGLTCTRSRCAARSTRISVGKRSFALPRRARERLASSLDLDRPPNQRRHKYPARRTLCVVCRHIHQRRAFCPGRRTGRLSIQRPRRPIRKLPRAAGNKKINIPSAGPGAPSKLRPPRR